ncbi:MAG: hypothetical protein ACOCQD_01900 [archaeon]
MIKQSICPRCKKPYELHILIGNGWILSCPNKCQPYETWTSNTTKDE